MNQKSSLREVPQFVLRGADGKQGLEFKRPAVGAASDGWRWLARLMRCYCLGSSDAIRPQVEPLVRCPTLADSDGRTESEGALQSAAGQVKDAARGMVDNLGNAGSAAYDQGSELVAKSPGSALLMAGLIGFALGVILTKGSQPRRNSLQRYYDRYGP